MPTNRTRRTRAPSPDAITHEAASAWVQGDFHLLNRCLGIRPWMVSPFDASGPRPPAWARALEPWTESWARGWELRQALIAVAGPPGRMDRHGRPLGPAA
jgi:hypothetical protein